MGVLRSGARGYMPATAKRLASWRVLKEMLQSFLRRCSLLDVLESLTVGTCVQHFFQVLSRGGGSLAQVFACPGHNFFFPCSILRFACPVFVDKCTTKILTVHILWIIDKKQPPETFQVSRGLDACKETKKVMAESAFLGQLVCC